MAMKEKNMSDRRGKEEGHGLVLPRNTVILVM